MKNNLPISEGDAYVVQALVWLSKELDKLDSKVNNLTTHRLLSTQIILLFPFTLLQ